ncbi:MAG: hypothetical protein IH988_04420 [Planctomycetes bacterium]|nr:hypothetical protein [Planctomycetota bacterium]
MHFHRSGIGVALIGAVGVVGVCSIPLSAFAQEWDQDGRTLVRAGEKDNLATQSAGARGAGGTCPGDGNCCIPNDTPGCDDEKCCLLVCFSNVFCCEQPWGPGCVELAEALCEFCDACEDDLDCDDGDDCTFDSCKVDTGQCFNDEIHCDDGDQCTDDFCQGGECQHTDTGHCCEGCGTCAGDGNCDGAVDPLDSGAILARFSLDPCNENEDDCKYDVNCDGAIDPLDTGFVLARFGQCNEPEACTKCDPLIDNCEDAPIDTLNIDETLSYDGDNTDATSTCAALGYDGETWHAFDLTETADVTTSLCGTDPVFGNAFIVLEPTCPCSGAFIFADSFEQTTCTDTNYAMHYGNLPAGVYYAPVLKDFSATGLYTWNIGAVEVGDVCGPGNGGSCCTTGGNGTPGCDDEACCEAICATDPFCCDESWDGICANQGQQSCEVCAP